MNASTIEALFPYDLYKHPFPPSAVKFTIEDLFPRSKIKPAASNGNDDFPPHDLPLQVGIPVIFTSPIVAVPGNRFMRSKFLKPFFIVMVQSRFIIVDKNGSRDVHGIYDDYLVSLMISIV